MAARPRSMSVTRPIWWLGLALMYVPIATLVIYSFINHSGTRWFFSLDAYRQLIADQDIGDSVQTSLLIAVCSATISVILGGFAAFGTRRARGWVDPSSAG
jgi:ABC-type spermidine/putrescine transport system permease subunit II